MNLETSKTPKAPSLDFDLDELDFKPITSGLGFHHQKTTEVKPSFHESAPRVVTREFRAPEKKLDSQVYQNDLSLFYGKEPVMIPEVKVSQKEVTLKVASKPERVMAYVVDVLFLGSILGLILTVMARTIDMDLMVAWSEYPHEITPLVVTLFCGFYLIYFSIFEKTASSTLGKNLLGLRVVTADQKLLSFGALFLRSFVTLLNFASLGLFSYFDLQNKMTDSKIVKSV